uniref:Exostosin GT47 domain-containing protein n=1 Tax=Chromera velia CCMP2878 TaxID=1169474 RepID=A0A0G4GQI1_9ALVE|eukprot:Cvel_5033.t1-p1 / transcript=Cvel_5033.t1 / gene=Cvel_5033 / organism=Chromera_velia_CCMP2878 / gene_product=Exostosin-1, putative / transcript_product=Exostosin-1, putative / location=Cvel_scaffold229:18851-25054(-) / protein_length=589 / sequence_SO=supercontig / SO=protein_coding / is_pseudo=false
MKNDKNVYRDETGGPAGCTLWDCLQVTSFPFQLHIPIMQSNSTFQLPNGDLRAKREEVQKRICRAIDRVGNGPKVAPNKSDLVTSLYLTDISAEALFHALYNAGLRLNATVFLAKFGQKKPLPWTFKEYEAYAFIFHLETTKQLTFLPLYGFLFSSRKRRFLLHYRHCSLRNEQCFDLKRCIGKTSKVFVYGKCDGWDAFFCRLFERFPYRRWEDCKNEFQTKVLDPLVASRDFEIVSDPQEACWFLPWTYAEGAEFETYEGWTLARLRSLPFWNQGRNHLLQDHSDDEYAAIDGDFAILARASSSHKFFRQGFDVPVHLRAHDAFLEEWKQRTAPGGQGIPIPGDRDILASFEGWFASAEEVREKLCRAVSSADTDVLVSLQRNGWVQSCGGFAGTLESSDKALRYKEVLLRSKFTFAPQGNGRASHRLIEATLLGSVPVMIANDAIPPWDELSEFSAWCIWWPSQRLPELMKTLRGISDERLRAMQAEGQRMAQTLLTQPRMLTALRLLRTRVDAILNSGSAVPSNLLSPGNVLINRGGRSGIAKFGTETAEVLQSTVTTPPSRVDPIEIWKQPPSSQAETPPLNFQ